jgi:hypothetical protein
MCTPLLAAGAVLTAAGAGASYYGQRKQQEAYDQVANAQADAARRTNQQTMALQQAERARQQQYTDQSQSLIKGSTANNSASSQQAQEGQLAQQLGSQYGASANQAADMSNIPGINTPTATGDDNKVVGDAYKNAFAQAKDYLGQQAQGKANLDAFGNLQKNTGIANARQLQQQGILGNFMQGSTSALANELAANSENGQLLQANAANAGNGALQQAALWNGLGSLGMSLGTQGLAGGLKK